MDPTPGASTAAGGARARGDHKVKSPRVRSAADLLARVDEEEAAVEVLTRLIEQLRADASEVTAANSAARAGSPAPASAIPKRLRPVSHSLAVQLHHALDRAQAAHRDLRSATADGLSKDEIRLSEAADAVAAVVNAPSRRGAAVAEGDSDAARIDRMLSKLSRLQPSVMSPLRARLRRDRLASISSVGSHADAMSLAYTGSPVKPALGGGLVGTYPVGPAASMTSVSLAMDPVAVELERELIGDFTPELLFDLENADQKDVDRTRSHHGHTQADVDDANVERQTRRIARASESMAWDDVSELPRVARTLCLRICQWPWFNRIVLALILLNCVFLSLDTPQVEEGSELRRTITVADTWLTALFTAEMFIKILAYGFVRYDDSYMQDPWNWLDALIVVTGWINLFAETAVNFSGLRTFRVLRPLRTISKLKGLRVLVTAFLKSVPLLVNTLVVLVFYFLIFGIIGLQMWKGLFHQRCYWVDTGLEVQEDMLHLCGGSNTCGEGQFCGAAVENPNSGITNFDNMFWAFNTIFQCVTLEGWAQVMYWAQDVSSGFASLYFVLLIFIGAFIVVNLTLAVILTNFRESSAAFRVEMAELVEKQRRLASERKRKIRKHQEKIARVSSMRAEILQRGSVFVMQQKDHRAAVLRDAAAKNPAATATAQLEKLSELAHAEAGSGAAAGVRRTISEATALKGGVPAYKENRRYSGLTIATDGSSPALGSTSDASGDDTGKDPLTLGSVVSRPKALPARRMSNTSGRSGRSGRTSVSSMDSSDERARSPGATERKADSTSLTRKQLRKEMRRKKRKDSALWGDQEYIPPNAETRVSAGVLVATDGDLQESHVLQSLKVSGSSAGGLKSALPPSSSSRRMSVESDNESTSSALSRWYTAPIRWTYAVMAVVEREKGVEGARWVSRHKAKFASQAPLESNGSCYPVWRCSRRMSTHVQAAIAASRDFTVRIVEHMWFRSLVTVAIILNTVALATEHYDMEPGLASFLDSTNVFFTIVFATEMALKLYALSAAGYVGDLFNVFDGVIVIISLAELFQDAASGLTVFRIVRIFRVVKLVRYFKSMQMIIGVISKSLESFGWIALLLLLFCFIFAVLGMQVFGGQLHEDNGSTPRSNWDSLHWAFVTVFQILAGEGWNEIMYLVVRATSPLTVFFFIAWLVIGQFTLLNLFVAVLLDNFENFGDEDESDDDSSSDEEEDGPASASGQGHAELLSPTAAREAHQRASADFMAPVPVKRRRSTDSAPPGSPKKIISDTFSQLLAIASPRGGLQEDSPDQMNWSDANPMFKKESADGKAMDSGGDRSGSARSLGSRKKSWRKTYRPPSEVKWVHRHLFCINPWGNLSRRCRALISADKPMFARDMCERRIEIYFDNVVLLLILASSVALASESPETLDNPPTSRVIVELVFTVLFTIEMSIKVVASGLVMHHSSYLRNGYNVIDFVVVVAALVNLALKLGGGETVGFLKLTRSLRPLRVIARSRGMRTVVHALLMSLIGIVNVVLVLLMVWLMFAILGVQLFGGKLHVCSDPSFPDATSRFGVANTSFVPGDGGSEWLVAPCDNTRTFITADGTEATAEWNVDQPNFDSFFEGMLSVFIMSSGEGWPSLMFRTADAVGVNVSPKRDASPMSAYYFVAFVCLGLYFIMNLFVGVVFKNFMRLKARSDEFGFLTPEQRAWVDAQRALFMHAPPRREVLPPPGWRRKVYQFVTNPAFDASVMAVIILNVLMMASRWQGEPALWVDVTVVANYVFAALFTIEAALKLMCYGREEYFSNAWNSFDFLVVVGSLLDIASDVVVSQFSAADIDLSSAQVVARVFRILRVLRIVRLAKSIKGLRRIIATMVSSAPALANVGSLLGLLFFIYSIVGMSAFGQVEYQFHYNEYANYRTFGVALITLFRVSTGEGWEELMFESADPAKGGTKSAALFYVSFITIAMFVMLNLFIMIILEDFDKSSKPETETVHAGLTAADILTFQREWAKFDPDGAGWIRASDLSTVLKALPPPLGLPITATQTQWFNYMDKLDVATVLECVQYNAVIVSLHRESFHTDIPPSLLSGLETNPTNLTKSLAKKLERSSKERNQLLATADTSKMDHAALTNKASFAVLVKPKTFGNLLAGIVVRNASHRWVMRAKKKVAERHARQAAEAEARRKAALAAAIAPVGADSAAASTGPGAGESKATPPTSAPRLEEPRDVRDSPIMSEGFVDVESDSDRSGRESHDESDYQGYRSSPPHDLDVAAGSGSGGGALPAPTAFAPVGTVAMPHARRESGDSTATATTGSGNGHRAGGALSSPSPVKPAAPAGESARGGGDAKTPSSGGYATSGGGATREERHESDRYGSGSPSGAGLGGKARAAVVAGAAEGSDSPPPPPPRRQRPSRVPGIGATAAAASGASRFRSLQREMALERARKAQEGARTSVSGASGNGNAVESGAGARRQSRARKAGTRRSRGSERGGGSDEHRMSIASAARVNEILRDIRSIAKGHDLPDDEVAV